MEGVYFQLVEHGVVDRCVETEGGTFTFDRVFDPDCPQSEVYDYAAKPIIRGVMQVLLGSARRGSYCSL